MRLSTIAYTLLLTAQFVVAADDKPRKDSQYTVGSSLQPLVILGEGWSQQFVIVNVSYYSPEPTVGTLAFYREGQPWRVPIKGRGTVDRINLVIPPGGIVMLETEVSNGQQVLGWADFDLVDDTDQWGIYRAYTVFRKQTPGQPDLMTSVPFAESLEDEWVIPMDLADGKYPGIGIVNTSTFSSGTYTFEVYDLNGTRIKTFSKTVRARSLSWFSLVGEHPDLAGRQGQIKVSGGPVYSSAVFSLQFAGNGAFTAIPIVQTYGMR